VISTRNPSTRKNVESTGLTSGKFAEVVSPTTWAPPAASTATSHAMSLALPPRKVE
jgi:hypothetical protein